MVAAMSDDTRIDARNAESSDEARLVARRHFLRAAIYAAPVIASVVAVNHASAVISCVACHAPVCPGTCALDCPASGC